MDRRRFLWLIGGASGGLQLASAVLPRAGEQRELRAEEQAADSRTTPARLDRTSWALGSRMSITAFHDDRGRAAAALDAAFAELQLVESLMSIYRPQSQLSRLNRDGQLEDAHPYLVEVLQAAEMMARRTDGAFDVTVQTLWELYARAAEQQRLPQDEEIEAARRQINWQHVQIRGSRIRLDGPRPRVTLNGIAQGFAADRAAAALAARGVQHALIDTGEIGALGCKPTGGSWTVGIQHPRSNDALLLLADLSGRCLATSGDYATKFSSDYRSNHLFDPRTGRSPTTFSSVSIAAPSALQADALSTAVFVLGLEAGKHLIQATPGADALLVLKDGRTLSTAGFPVAS